MESGKTFFGPMGPKLWFVFIREDAVVGGHKAQHPHCEWWWEHRPVGILQQPALKACKGWRMMLFSLQESCSSGEDSFSNHAMPQNRYGSKIGSGQPQSNREAAIFGISLLFCNVFV